METNMRGVVDLKICLLVVVLVPVSWFLVAVLFSFGD